MTPNNTATPSPLPEMFVKISGKSYGLNTEQTHVYFGAAWREIQDDQDGEKYFRAGGDIYYLDKPTPSANELESSEMERAIVDVPAEAGDVYEYLDGEDGNFASQPAPEGWETVGNEREKDAQKWREEHPEAAKWFDAYKNGNELFLKLVRGAADMKRELEEVKAVNQQYAAYINYCDGIILNDGGKVGLSFVQWREQNNLPQL